jgi:hypothetical protein
MAADRTDESSSRLRVASSVLEGDDKMRAAVMSLTASQSSFDAEVGDEAASAAVALRLDPSAAVSWWLLMAVLR